MLDQLFNIVKQFGQETVVNNPDVPNEFNQEVMADATQTIAGGFKNIVAGGGLQNILDLFKGGGGGANNGSGGGIGGLMKNPIVSMMVGYFISKLVRKYSMSPSVASDVANKLIPSSLNGLIEQTKDPNNPNLNMDGFIGSLIGSGATEESEEQEEKSGGSPLQDLIEKFTGGDGGGNSSGGGGFDLQDIISKFTQKSQNSFQNEGGGGGGLL
ncbi:MAG: hypothetical protein V9F01_17125 [Chitinophagaceae bacterium]